MILRLCRIRPPLALPYAVRLPDPHRRIFWSERNERYVGVSVTAAGQHLTKLRLAGVFAVLPDAVAEQRLPGPLRGTFASIPSCFTWKGLVDGGRPIWMTVFPSQWMVDASWRILSRPSRGR